MTHFLFSEFAILGILRRLLWWALGHEKFCLRLLRLLLKFAPFCERHSFLCIVAVYMLMEERSIHIMILTLQYVITDSRSSLTFVIDDCFSQKWNPYYKITGQELIPVKIWRNSDARVFWAPFLPFNFTVLGYSCYSSAICGLIHGLLYLYSLQTWTFTNWNNFGCYRCWNQIVVSFAIFAKFVDC